MNVLIITKSFPESAEDWNGIFVKEQVEALATGHNVTVVKCSIDYKKFRPFFRYTIKEEHKGNYTFCKISVCRSFPVYNQLNYLLTVSKAIAGMFRNARPEIIHCHFSYPCGVIGWLLSLRSNIPFIVTEHSRLTSVFRSFFHRKLALKGLSKACKVIAVSSSLEKEIIEQGVRNTIVVPNVIGIENFQLTSGKRDPFTIGFLGELNSDNKGLDILISACSELPFDFKLKIGGNGKRLNYYKDMSGANNMGNRAEFIEKVNTRSSNGFYSDINLFVVASKYETFGMVLIEAMASGIPVIATRCGGPEDIVNGIAGLLTDVGNAVMMREAIIKIHSNYDRFEPQKIRDYAVEAFGQRTFLSRINSIYKSCL